ncbi:phage tail assembly protein [Herminiimonas sp. CN]|uniref:phage tail assembly protein n=1 Tax=Herminiimonas sp. CN TaxID=1349818 RepID=UPI000473CD1D|nr:phage tail assembly protein [Herminiimonas sp. CN]
MAATYTGQFKKGMKVGKEIHMDFELREMTTADMLDAEMEVPASKVMNFSAALASLQLVRVGTYDGPFTLKMVRALEPDDFNALRDGLSEVASLGEESLPSKATD